MTVHCYEMKHNQYIALSLTLSSGADSGWGWDELMPFPPLDLLNQVRWEF